MKNYTVKLTNCSLEFPKRIRGMHSLFDKSSSYRALDNLNLIFEEGDRVGLIGINGSGKSTLLRLISKIYIPTMGKVEVRGSIFALLDFSAGLDNELTGKENLYRIGILRGLDKKIIDSNIQHLENFCELGDFFHEPLYTYSTGMRIRIGLSLLMLYKPNILTFDEGIGAGDTFFVSKAQALVKKTLESTNTLFIASHSEGLLKTFVNKAVLLNEGKVIFYGEVSEAYKEYINLINILKKNN